MAMICVQVGKQCIKFSIIFQALGVTKQHYTSLEEDMILALSKPLDQREWRG